MSWTFSDIVRKRAALRDPLFGMPKTKGAKTYRGLMAERNASSSPAAEVDSDGVLPDNSITTILGNNINRIDGANLVRIG